MTVEDFGFSPFYERLAERFPQRAFGKLLVSALVGLSFLPVHFLSVGKQVFGDWSWFLGLLTTTAMLCLYYATHTLRGMVSRLEALLGDAGCRDFMTPLGRTLSDRNFVLAGFFFGTLNCLCGLSFGLPYSDAPAMITIVTGYFLAGFVCGMAVWGIYGVCVSTRAVTPRLKSSVDFTSPDSCGGTSFLGEALVVFGSVTLIVGVMISVYIWKTDWTGDEAHWWIVTLKWFWMAFPYAMSFVAIMVPASSINRALTEYKLEEDALLKNRLSGIREQLGGNHLDAAERQELRDDYAFQQGIRADLHKMRTWPFGIGANVKYFSILGVNLFVSANNATKWIGKFFGGAGS